MALVPLIKMCLKKTFITERTDTILAIVPEPQIVIAEENQEIEGCFVINAATKLLHPV